MQINDLWVMQNGLRNIDQLPAMIDFVSKNHFWTQKNLEEYAAFNLLKTSPLIQISVFEDGQKFIHDGTHRVAATWLAGRDFLRQEEFILTEWTYAKYLEVNPKDNWFTPFDPRLHVRLPELHDYKTSVKKLYESGKLSEEEFWFDIINRCTEYRVERGNLTTIESLISYLGITPLGLKLIKGLSDFADKLKNGDPVEVTRVERYETPDGPMHLRSKKII